MNKSPHPNSPAALAKASLWRHMKTLAKHSVEDGLMAGKEICLMLSVFVFNLSFLLLFPVTFPLFAWVIRNGYQKQVRQWDRQLKRDKMKSTKTTYNQPLG